MLNDEIFKTQQLNKDNTIMKHKKKTIVLLVAFFVVIFPYRFHAQEVFSNRTPSQEYLQNQNKEPGSMLRAGAGTGTGRKLGCQHSGYKRKNNP